MSKFINKEFEFSFPSLVKSLGMKNRSNKNIIIVFFKGTILMIG